MTTNTPDADEVVICDMCGGPVTDEQVHFFHEDDCPNFRQPAVLEPCTCDGVAHPDCCPECNEHSN